MKSRLGIILPKIFRRKNSNCNFNNMCTKLDELIIDLWDKQHEELIKLDNNELAATIWGYCLKGELSSAQKEIHSQLNILVQQIIYGLKEDSVSKDKVVFVKMLIKNYIAIKLAYLRDVTCLKTKIMHINTINQNHNENQTILH